MFAENKSHQQILKFIDPSVQDYFIDIIFVGTMAPTATQTRFAISIQTEEKSARIIILHYDHHQKS